MDTHKKIQPNKKENRSSTEKIIFNKPKSKNGENKVLVTRKKDGCIIIPKGTYGKQCDDIIITPNGILWTEIHKLYPEIFHDIKICDFAKYPDKCNCFKNYVKRLNARLSKIINPKKHHSFSSQEDENTDSEDDKKSSTNKSNTTKNKSSKPSNKQSARSSNNSDSENDSEGQLQDNATKDNEPGQSTTNDSDIESASDLDKQNNTPSVKKCLLGSCTKPAAVSFNYCCKEHGNYHKNLCSICHQHPRNIPYKRCKKCAGKCLTQNCQYNAVIKEDYCTKCKNNNNDST